MAGMEIPITAIREYIENAIDIVVQTSRLSDGRRKITSICEIVGFEKESIKLKEIFEFKQSGVKESGEVIGEFIKNEYTPKVYNKLKSRGINNIKDIFE